MHPLVKQLEGIFLAHLDRLAIELRQQYPGLTFTIWSTPTGTLTDYQGHDLGIECIFKRDSKTHAENVALMVEMCHLTSAPRLMGEVVWSQGSDHSDTSWREWRLMNEWPVASQEAVSDLESTFPELISAYRKAVAQGASKC
jgi:hypothetical protein